jgi:hypothetical protein
MLRCYLGALHLHNRTVAPSPDVHRPFMAGRKKSSCREYVLEDKPDSDGIIKFTCKNCSFFRKTKLYGATIWADHLVLDCAKTDKETKRVFAQVLIFLNTIYISQ